MTQLLKIKIAISLCCSLILIALGIFNYFAADKDLAGSLMVFGLISGSAGLLWIYMGKRLQQRNNSR